MFTKILIAITVLLTGFSIGVAVSPHILDWEYTTADTSPAYSIYCSGFINDYITNDVMDWESKYKTLWEAYKHTCWHYDAQAENLREERDNLFNLLVENGYYKTDNITIDIMPLR